jgi:hypothetical protein
MISQEFENFETESEDIRTENIWNATRLLDYLVYKSDNSNMKYAVGKLKAHTLSSRNTKKRIKDFSEIL